MRNLKWTILAVAGLCAGCFAVDRAALATCANQSKPGQAIAACSGLLKKGALDKANREYVLFNRGQAYGTLGETEPAIADVDAVLELNPDNAMAHGLRGALLARQGKFDDAMVEFDRALALNPLDYYALVNRGGIHEKRGRYPQAIAEFDRAIDVDSDNTAAWGGRCWARAVVGEDLEGAVADCSHAMARDADPNLRNSRGFAYYRLQRYDEAIADYDASIAGDPKVASSYYVRGLARRALGDEAAARADIAKGIELEPGIAARYAGFGVDAQ